MNWTEIVAKLGLMTLSPASVADDQGTVSCAKPPPAQRLDGIHRVLLVSELQS
jgi:hypothetical protein